MEFTEIFLAASNSLINLAVNNPLSAIFGASFAALALLRLYSRLTLGICDCDQDMTGRTILITGASAGIGKATAQDLAKRNARVLLACRNLRKAQKVADEIQLATGNKDVHVKLLDLCSFESVRKCAQDILETEDKLHVLINNAGISGMTRGITEDNCDRTMQSNHLGHFLLTLLLLDLLKRSAPSRIINVASTGYVYSNKDIDDMHNEKGVPALTMYANTKLANLLFTKELSSRLSGTGITVNALHPGWVKTDILQRDTCLFARFIKFQFLIIGKTSEEGAQTTIHLAVSPELEKTTGKFFVDCKETALKAEYVTEDMAKRLFEISENIVGVSFVKP